MCVCDLRACVCPCACACRSVGRRDTAVDVCVPMARTIIPLLLCAYLASIVFAVDTEDHQTATVSQTADGGSHAAGPNRRQMFGSIPSHSHHPHSPQYDGGSSHSHSPHSHLPSQPHQHHPHHPHSPTAQDASTAYPPSPSPPPAQHSHHPHYPSGSSDGSSGNQGGDSSTTGTHLHAPHQHTPSTGHAHSPTRTEAPPPLQRSPPTPPGSPPPMTRNQVAMVHVRASARVRLIGNAILQIGGD